MNRDLHERCTKLTKEFLRWELMKVFCDKAEKQFDNPREAARYREIVGRPMCLEQVRKNLKRDRYQSLEEYERDMNQIWANAKNYNHESDTVYWFAECGEARFKAKMAKMKMSPVELYLTKLRKVAQRVTKLADAFKREMDHLPSSEFANCK